MALELIEIKDFPRTTSVTGSGDELIVVSKADGKTYGIKTSDFKAFLGTVQVVAPKALAPTDPAPTLDGVYIPTVTQNEAGTPIVYTNAGGLTVNTAEGSEDYGKAVRLINDGGEWVKVGVDMPIVPINNTLDSTSTTEAASANVARSINDKIKSITIEGAAEEREYFNFTLHPGVTGPGSGLINDSTNWIHAEIIGVSELTAYDFEGFGNTSSSVINGAVPRVVFYKDTFNNGGYLGEVLGDGIVRDEMQVITPATCNAVMVVMDGGSGIGTNPATSPFNDSFKFYHETLNPDALLIDTGKIIDRIDSDQIIGIEDDVQSNKTELSGIDKGNKYYDGLGVPSSDLGINTDKYIDTISLRMYIKKNGDWGDGYFLGGESDFDYPIGFSYNPFQIKKQSNGVFVPDNEGLFTQYVKADYDRLTKYYVDPVNGSDANNGLSQSSAFKDISIAVTSKGARNIELIPSDIPYPFGTRLADLLDVSTSDPLIIRGVKGKSIISQSHAGDIYSWALGSNNTYSTTRSNVAGILDMSLRNKYDNFSSFKNTSSVAECEGSAGSWFLDGTTLYVHTLDGRNPDADILIQFATLNRYTPSANIPYIYIEGVSFYTVDSGQSLLIRNDPTTQLDTKVYLSGVEGVGNIQGNGIAIDNIKEAYLENCGGSQNKRDTLNYHTSLLSNGYEPMKVVEHNGYSIDTGINFPSEGSSNGSTMHEGGTILRLNGRFENGQGPIVADVGDGIRSLNLNVVANNSILDSGAGFQLSGADTEMWLYGCTSIQPKSGNVSARSITGTIYYDSETKLPQGVEGDVVPI